MLNKQRKESLFIVIIMLQLTILIAHIIYPLKFMLCIKQFYPSMLGQYWIFLWWIFLSRIIKIQNIDNTYVAMVCGFLLISWWKQGDLSGVFHLMYLAIIIIVTRQYKEKKRLTLHNIPMVWLWIYNIYLVGVLVGLYLYLII